MTRGLWEPFRSGGIACRAKAMEVYVRGVRVGCARIAFDSAAPCPSPDLLDRVAGSFDLPLAMTHLDGPAPAGWITVPRGASRPVLAAREAEALLPLSRAHFARMRGLFGLYAGRFSGMPVREDPAWWAERMAALHRPLGLFEEDRLLLWLDVRGDALLELAAAPDALHRVPGALLAAGVALAPAPVLALAPEIWDDRLKMRLNRSFSIPGLRVETPGHLARAMDGAAQWGL